MAIILGTCLPAFDWQTAPVFDHHCWWSTNVRDTDDDAAAVAGTAGLHRSLDPAPQPPLRPSQGVFGAIFPTTTFVRRDGIDPPRTERLSGLGLRATGFFPLRGAAPIHQIACTRRTPAHTSRHCRHPGICSSRHQRRPQGSGFPASTTSGTTIDFCQHVPSTAASGGRCHPRSRWHPQLDQSPHKSLHHRQRWFPSLQLGLRQCPQRTPVQRI